MPNGYVTVPAGSKPVPCAGPSLGGSCTKMIYWSVNPRTGKSCPVDCDVPGGRRPSEAKIKGQLDAFSGEARVFDGRGRPHMLDCVDKDRILRAVDERRATDVPARKRA